MLPFDQSFPMMMYRTLDAVMPVYRELFARFELTEQQWRVLRVIWTSKNVTSADLSERTLLSPQSLVSMIDRLESRGLVNRVRSVDDRRRVYVVATSKGRALQDQVTPHVLAIHDKIRRTLSSAEWAALEQLLTKVETGITADTQKIAANG